MFGSRVLRIWGVVVSNAAMHGRNIQSMCQPIPNSEDETLNLKSHPLQFETTAFPLYIYKKKNQTTKTENLAKSLVNMSEKSIKHYFITCRIKPKKITLPKFSNQSISTFMVGHNPENQNQN